MLRARSDRCRPEEGLKEMPMIEETATRMVSLASFSNNVEL